MTKIIKLLCVVFTLSATLQTQALPTPDSMTYDVSFTTQDIIQLENVYAFGPEYTGPQKFDIPTFYKKVNTLIKIYGGELTAVLEVYDVAEGVKRPRYSAFIKWPSIDAFRAYRADKRYGKLSTAIHTDRMFFTVANDTQITFNTDLNYEVFSGTISPSNAANLPEFFARVPNAFGKDYGRNQIMTFVPLDIPENSFNADFGGLVEWPSINHIKLFVDAIEQQDLDLRNTALERIDQYNGRILPNTANQN